MQQIHGKNSLLFDDKRIQFVCVAYIEFIEEKGAFDYKISPNFYIFFL